MAKIVRFHEIGGPEVLHIESGDPGRPQAGEVLIHVEAIGLNRAEAVFRAGNYFEKPQFPARIGYEASGVVEAVGSGVTGLSVGDAVNVVPGFSMNRYGVYGDCAIVPASSVVPRLAGLTATEAAAVWMAYPTAYGGLIDIGKLQAGDHLIITAASSSVGLAAIQIAKAIGAVPIATTRNSTKRDALLAAGAAHVIVTGEQDLVEGIQEITHGAGANLIFDPIAGPSLATLAATAAKQGTVILYGNLSGGAEQMLFPWRPAISRGLTVRAYLVFELIGNRQCFEQCRAFIADGVASGKLAPVIDRVFPLEAIVDAHRYLESNQQLGKIVVTV